MLIGNGFTRAKSTLPMAAGPDSRGDAQSAGPSTSRAIPAPAHSPSGICCSAASQTQMSPSQKSPTSSRPAGQELDISASIETGSAVSKRLVQARNGPLRGGCSRIETNRRFLSTRALHHCVSLRGTTTAHQVAHCASGPDVLLSFPADMADPFTHRRAHTHST